MRDQLLEYLNDRRLNNGFSQAVSSGDDLLLSGIVDSIGLVQLIGFIEEQSGLNVPDEDVTIDNFGSVDLIVDYLGHLQEKRQAQKSQ